MGYQWKLAVVGLMHRTGVGLLAGTDFGSKNAYVFAGFSLHDELARFVEAGLTPREVLQKATVNPAKFLGREKDFGRIEKGQLADAVVLDANPLEDIANTRRINAVVLNGRYFDRKALDAMLADAEAMARRK